MINETRCNKFELTLPIRVYFVLAVHSENGVSLKKEALSGFYFLCREFIKRRHLFDLPKK